MDDEVRTLRHEARKAAKAARASELGQTLVNTSGPRRTAIAHLVHWQYLLAEWDAEHERNRRDGDAALSAMDTKHAPMQALLDAVWVDVLRSVRGAPGIEHA